MMLEKSEVMINLMVLEYITNYKIMSRFKRYRLEKKIKKTVKKQCKVITKEMINSMVDDESTYVTNNLFKYIVDCSNAVMSCCKLVNALAYGGRNIVGVIKFMNDDESTINNILYSIRFSKLNTASRNWVYLNKKDIEINILYEMKDDKYNHTGHYDIIYGEPLKELNTQFYIHNIHIIEGLRDQLIRRFDRCKKYIK